MSAVLDRIEESSLIKWHTFSAVTPAAEMQHASSSSAITQDQVSRFLAIIKPHLSWAQEQVAPLSTYGKNWDGYNADPVHARALVISILLLASMKSTFDIGAPCVNPVRDGGVSLEWEKDNKYLEIECCPPNPFSQQHIANYLFDSHEGEIKSGPITEESAQALFEVLSLIFSKKQPFQP